MILFTDLKNEFDIFLKLEEWSCSYALEKEFNELCTALCSNNVPIYQHERERVTLRIICEKLDMFNSDFKQIVDYCASIKVYFNYHEKNKLQSLLNENDIEGLKGFLVNKLNYTEFENTISLNVFDKHYIIDKLHLFITENFDKKDDILESIFSSLLFSIFPIEIVHKYYSNSITYESSFYKYLQLNFPDKFDRSKALVVINITEDYFLSFNNYDSFLSNILPLVRDKYYELQNHCYFSIIIDKINLEGQSITWKLYSDIVLYAEKFIEENLKIGYFHPRKIEDITAGYISNIDKKRACFDISNTGYTYKDCIIVTDSKFNKNQSEIFSDCKLALLFQKNQRDEDVIPCPACRSFNVRGNSYPILGVKSWECNNPLCFDKSKFNRGKRYSFSSIVKQEAIERVDSHINKECINEWRLDVVFDKKIEDILEFLTKHYSFDNDNIELYNFNKQKFSFGRKINYLQIPYAPDIRSLDFFNSSYFQRFLIDNTLEKSNLNSVDISNFDTIQIYNSDCFDVLRTVPSNTFDGAVTSPPYYNAKEYSNWPNIYCFLYDIFNHTKEIYRTLKPGSYYLFNIFDYFDNENNIVFSAMGKKRMILGAYIIHVFQKIGFEIDGNTIWFKGHIQGHRSTNQGNISPYYQSPLNCYEHILRFKKPDGKVDNILFPDILNAKPVYKMVKGINILGHSAPFPFDIPYLLVDRMNSSGMVLEPYAGSFTTARAAYDRNISSFNIEYNSEFCQLGLHLIKEHIES